ncbi:MAG: SDR family NAD(P)-dependent oxidoreductase [Alphaproteobacteria bacterium]|nr:SDR family NAD(P)-dependent oxidoreductase [Alphaproteobacteria bacterium]
MVALITGGCGFIGSHLADALVASGMDVIILDNLSTGKQSNAPSKAKLVVGDVADAALVHELVGKADLVFHLAAVASVELCERDAENSHRTNFIGTKNVLDAAAASPKKPLVVYASSAAVYGDNPNLPLAESAETTPLGNYGRDKLAGEVYAQQQNIRSVGLRFFNVFGPRQDPRSPYSGVISIFTDRALAGQDITYFGDGEQTRDFIYVGDIVKLLLAASNHSGPAAVANGCTGKATSLKQLVATLAELVGTAPKTAHAEARKGDIRHSLGNPEQAKKLLGFTATTPLKDGLAALVGASQKEAAHA